MEHRTRRRAVDIMITIVIGFNVAAVNADFVDRINDRFRFYQRVRIILGGRMQGGGFPSRLELCRS